MNKDIEYKERRDKVSIDEEVMIKMEYHGKPASVMEQPLLLSHLILSTLQFGYIMEQPLSPLSYLFDLINYASLILLNKLSILFHPIIVGPCGQYYKVQGWAHV